MEQERVRTEGEEYFDNMRPDPEAAIGARLVLVLNIIDWTGGLQIDLESHDVLLEVKRKRKSYMAELSK